MGYLSKSIPPGKMLACGIRIGLKVGSKSSEFLKDCRDQDFAFCLLCRFGLNRQCRLFLFRCHIINIYKYAYLCNFSHKCDGFCGFARFFLVKLRVLCKFQHKMCRFLVYLGKCLYIRIRLYTLVYACRGCIRLFLLNTRLNNAIALKLLCRCSTIA